MTDAASDTLGNYFRVRKEKGKPGLPTLSVTMNDGLVDRSDLDRKMETNLSPEQHLSVLEGDIAYNMMRMWQGAFGRADKDGIVSPAYVVVKPRDTVDSRFAAHWFKSARMIHLFWAYSYGLTEDRLRLYADDFCQIPASPPPLAEQRRIADILDTWNRAIAKAEALASQKRLYFDHLIQELVGRHQRMHLVRDDWTRLELSALVSFKSGGTPSKTEAAYWGGPVPWISAKDLKEFDVAASIQTLTAEGAARASIVPENTILLLVRGMGLFKDIPIGVTRRPVAFNQDIKALIPVEKIDSRFLAYALKSWRTVLMDRVDRAGHGTGRLAMDFIETLPIAFPSIAQQQRIVATLDTADSEIQTITSLASKLAIQRSAVASTLLNSAPRRSESEAAE